jgi:hypothetical protein
MLKLCSSRYRGKTLFSILHGYFAAPSNCVYLLRTFSRFPRKKQLASDSPRLREAVGRKTKTSKTEEELSPGTKALLCDEGDVAHLHDSKQTRKLRKLGKGTTSSSALMERESSVMSELTKNIQKIVVSCCKETLVHFSSASLDVCSLFVTAARFFLFIR